jgi:acetoin utilization deacetylase AcuC-like enzyme
VTVLFVTHERFLDHDAGAGHPERPARIQAARRGLSEAGLDDLLVPVPPTPASREAIERVHHAAMVDELEALSARGGGPIDLDTHANDHSFAVARLAAGAGLTAVEGLRSGEHTAAYCAVRPPGHHATPAQAMGFCFLNSVAITAAALAAEGARVAIVDIDAHHGNGTQDAFYERGDVLYVSLHQSPLYPGTGSADEVGSAAGLGATINVPLPVGATGDVYRLALETIVVPALERFAPSWLLLSVGFDAHRADPLTGLALSAGDYADALDELRGCVDSGRTIAFLEGGYDLGAVALGSAATVAALSGERRHDEAPTSGGRGRDAVAAARAVHERVVAS